MLSLTRRVGESVVFDGVNSIQVIQKKGNSCRFAEYGPGNKIIRVRTVKYQEWFEPFSVDKGIRCVFDKHKGRQQVRLHIECPDHVVVTRKEIMYTAAESKDGQAQ